jgi:hypothetical protein
LIWFGGYHVGLGLVGSKFGLVWFVASNVSLLWCSMQDPIRVTNCYYAWFGLVIIMFGLVCWAASLVLFGGQQLWFGLVGSKGLVWWQQVWLDLVRSKFGLVWWAASLVWSGGQ